MLPQSSWPKPTRLKRIDAARGLNRVHPRRPGSHARSGEGRAMRCLHSGHGGPLTGVPIAHKDVFVTSGWRSTAGSGNAARTTKARSTPPLPSVCRAPAWCASARRTWTSSRWARRTKNSYFGPVQEPVGIVRRCRAARRAARRRLWPRAFAPAATGTDTGGSIRQPASCRRGHHRHQADFTAACRATA